MLGVPAGEIALLIAAVMAAGIATGILAGLFGIGGGAIIVPVLYEIFRILGVPEEVRMQLCVGTSMAIIIPTTIRSYIAHNAKGMVLNDVMRAWAVPAVLGVAAGSVIAYFAPSAVFKVVFTVTVTIIAIKLLFGPRQLEDRRPVSRAAGDGRLRLPGRHHLIADGGERRLGLQHDPDALRQAAAQRGRDLLRPRACRSPSPAPIGLRLAGWSKMALLPPFSIGYVSLLGVAVMAPVSSFAAPYGALLAHRLSKRQLEIAFGIFLLLVSARFVASLL
jgi:uncharacterized membrane protein YfcA